MRKREPKIGPRPHLGQFNINARRASIQPEGCPSRVVPRRLRSGLFYHAIPIITYAPITVKSPRMPKAARIARAISALVVIATDPEWQRRPPPPREKIL